VSLEAVSGTLTIRRSDLTGSASSRFGISLLTRHTNVVVDNNVLKEFSWYAIALSVAYGPDPGSFHAAIRGNRLTGNGTAIYGTPWTNATLVIADNVVEDNDVGIDLNGTFGWLRLDVTGNRVQYNRRRGMDYRDSNQDGNNVLTVTRNVFADNAGDSFAEAGGLSVETYGTATVTHNIIAGNTSPASYGAGGVAINNWRSAVTFSHNLVAGNIGPYGGGAYLRANVLTAMANTFAHNTAAQTDTTWRSPFSALQVATSAGSRLNGNNLFGNTTRWSANRWVLGLPYPSVAFDATGNWWDTTDPSLIRAQIGLDSFFTRPVDANVDTGFPLTGINTDAPLSPPTGLVIVRNGSSASFTWNANPEGDVAGYRIWYGAPGDYSYTGTGAAEGASPIDVGNVTSFQLTGLPADTLITVTAYDTARDGVSDQIDGNESWFTPLEYPRLRIVSLTSDPEPPQPYGAYVSFHVATEGGRGPLQFQWRVWDGTQWSWTGPWWDGYSDGTDYFSWSYDGPNPDYRVEVRVRSVTNREDGPDNADSLASMAFPIGPPLPPTSVTLTAREPSPQRAGTNIFFTAIATGGSSPYQYKFRVSTDGGATYTTVQDWAQWSSVFWWTPQTAIADARISVWVRSTGVTVDAPQVEATMSYVVLPPSPIVLTSLTADTPSPRQAGSTIFFRANGSGGVTPYEYKWWVFDGTWQVAQNWSSSSIFIWTPMTPSSGYRIAVWLRNAGSTADAYDNPNANGSIGYVITVPPPPTITSIFISPQSPRVVGTSILFLANVTGGLYPYQYKWRVSTDGGANYTTAQDWSTTGSVFFWTPTSATDSARINVWVKNSGVDGDAPQTQATVPYVVTATSTVPPLTLNALTTNLATPQVSGTTITFTAHASGGLVPYQFKWWLYDGLTWSVLRDWNTGNTFAWTPTLASSAYRIAVWVRSAGNTADMYENANANGSIAYVITGGASPTTLAVTSVTRSHLSPQPVGTTMTFTANATGGIPPYQYKWRMSLDAGTSWFFPTDWSNSPTFVWTPSAPSSEVRIQVKVRNYGDVSENDGILHGTYSYLITAPPEPLTLNSIVPNIASPQAAGTSITFTANATGGTAPLQYKWWVFDGAWNVARDWGTSNTFAWTPATASSAYRIAVWVRSAGNTSDAYENANSNASIGYVITGAAGPPPLTLTSLTSNSSAPQIAGTSITFSTSSSGGTSPHQYKWRVSIDGGSSFTTAQDWSTNPSFTWTPGSAVADARITVWARNSGVTADAPQAQLTVSYVITAPAAGPLALNSIVPDMSAPRAAGTTITFTANASGGIGPYQYKWFLFDGAWNVVRDWSTSNTFAWTPATGSSAYRIAVWVRSAGNTADAYENADSNGSIGYAITGAAGPPPLSLTSLTANVASPQVAGTPITFTAAAAGGTAPYQLKWRLSTDGGASFTTAQDWSASATFTWTPGTAIADARITVWARNSGVSADAPQAQATLAYVITVPAAGPLVLNSIVPDMSPPRAAGTTITFTANASGGIGPYQYKWFLFDGSWNVVRDWSASNTFAWTPTAGSSAYRIAVWVKSAGNTADAYENADSNGSIGYAITGAAAPAPLSIASLTSNVPSPALIGTAITFTVAGAGGTAPYQFKWRISIDGGSSFTTVQDWSASTSFNWQTAMPVADARINVWARNSGVTADAPQAQATLAFVITNQPPGPPLSLNSITSDLPEPRAVLTTITFTANASGGIGPYQYKWWIFNGSWQVARDWNGSHTFAWTPASPSSAYRVAVWVRNAGSTTDAYDNANSNGSVGFVIVP
jgi:hypothetical protein